MCIRDSDYAGRDQGSDGGKLDNAKGLGRRNDPPVTPVRVVDYVPSLLAAPLGLLLVHETADWLGRVFERRVVGSHLCLADDCRSLPGHAETSKLVAEVLLQRVADRALAVRTADVQRDLVHLVGRKLGASQDEAHLRAIAMADGDIPAFLNHGDDVPASLLGRNVLVEHALVLLVLDERVATDRDYGCSRSTEHGFHGHSSVSSSSAPSRPFGREGGSRPGRRRSTWGRRSRRRRLPRCGPLAAGACRSRRRW